MESYVVRMRRQFHMYPEVGFDLPKTLATLRAELDRLGVSYTEEDGKSSIVATVNPEKNHFTIGVRADIDALPIEELNDVPYKSRHEGKMHACGHDAHTAIALATLCRVWEIRDQIGCCVKFLFQAAEEYSPSGAKLMVADGVMKDIDCIVGLHCDTNFDPGEVAITPAEQNATSHGFMLDFYGKSAHAALQQKGVDANMMAIRAAIEIELMLAKELDPKQPIVFNIGAIHGGTTNNIISDHCSMFCTLRTWEDATEEQVIGNIKRIINAVADLAGGTATFETVKHYPILYNNEVLTECVRKTARKMLGEDHVFENMRGLGGEDFSYFAREKPGAFLRLGVRNIERGLTISVHNGRFDLDEDALQVGVDLFTQFILDHQNGIEF